MAKRRLPDLADDHRCTRNGTNWRCHLPRLPGKSYCQKHHLFNLARSQSRSKTLKSQIVTLPNPSSSSNLREIWAFYRHPPPPADAADAVEVELPRLYARVERRIPNQSVVEVTPLLPYPDPSADVACGTFLPTDTTEMREMSTFSHRVWFEIAGDIYRIFPRKGEIWAVEQYGWVEMVSSFGDCEGPSGLVLEEEEEAGVFRRRLHEGCELIRRFSMEEVSMFLHRVAGGRVAGVAGGGSGGEGMLLQECTLIIEGEESNAQGTVTICQQPEPCNNISEANDVEEQNPDPSINEEERSQPVDGVSSMDAGCAYEIPMRSTAAGSLVEDNHQEEPGMNSQDNHQQPEIHILYAQEVLEPLSVESLCK